MMERFRAVAPQEEYHATFALRLATAVVYGGAPNAGQSMSHMWRPARCVCIGRAAGVAAADYGTAACCIRTYRESPG
ncbi:hypothetical protein GCM10009126_10360 [Rhodanobacter caeni]|uniref:Uncharacterized protein n=1 Tax=Rhodanobacter caeni TaxID=657654 RepID=A0ABP3DY85_9GAMM